VTQVNSSNIVGQSMIVGIRSNSLDKEGTRDFLKLTKPGGIILYAKNVESFSQLKALITDLQKIAIETTGRRYFIMIDEEPQGATRLNLFRDIFKGGKTDWAVISRDAAKLTDVGVNVDLAPLADHTFVGSSGIDRRIAIKDLAALKSFNREFISILRKNNISSTLKHFPGLGLISGDTHKGIFFSAAPTSTIDRSIEIFKDGVEAGADFVMLGHGIYKSLDPYLSASISPKIVSMIRAKTGFRGIIITDDITALPVGAPPPIDINIAAVRAFKAGNNMVMFSDNQTYTISAYKYLVKMYAEDRALKSILDSNYGLIGTYKNK
jgi:beta-N-acetylhexosaminidase